MLRDRGKMKWRGAFFMPEQVKMLKDSSREDLKVTKPILDEYQIEEFEQKLLLAMEFVYQVKIKVWNDGFFHDYFGLLQRLDELNKVIYIKTDVNITTLNFEDVTNDALIKRGEFSICLTYRKKRVIFLSKLWHLNL